METGSNTILIRSYSDCKISVFLSKDGYSFIVSNKDDDSSILINKSIVFPGNFPYQQAFEDSLRTNPELQQNYAAAEIILNVNRYTFVPKEFFSVEHSNSFYNFNLGDLSDKDGVFFSLLESAGFYVVFSYDKLFIDLLENIFPQAEFTPSISLFIDKIFQKGKSLINAVFAKINHNILEIVVFKSAKFVMANTFKFISPCDAEYFLLKSYNNYNLDNSKVPLFLDTDIEVPSVLDFVSNCTINENY